MSSSPDLNSSEDLGSLLNHLFQRMGHLETQLSSTQRVPATNKHPKVALPEKFDGSIGKCRDFVASVENIFALQPSCFATDEAKTRFIGTLLTKDALSWFRDLVERNSDLLSKYDAFMEDFQLLYSDPHKQRHAQSSLKRLKQGKGSVLTYSSRFRRLALDTGHNAEALRDQFREGLNDDVKDVLASNLTEPDQFEDFIRYCIKIDNRLYDRKLEKTSFKSGNTTFRSVQRFQGFRTNPDTQNQSVPMELDAITTDAVKKLSKAERDRRMEEKLCLYCGEAGHRVRYCPKKEKSKN